ncbi:hypothetical protein N3K66_007062 [Trichothecium roseum]|uniref:Uncharacterized protein n=1 Tax=Trichothecium roseum TaxID=47278 RepID=A0ACC0UX39_9HYPO|nr:hypothetical protein N3K66_007062 [Trichothecium roseum]
MGKPDDHDAAVPSTRAPPFTEPSSSISLHTQQDDYHSHHQQTDRYFDDDPAELQGDDLPPLYTDHVDDQPVTGSGPGTGGLVNPLLPAGVSGPKLRPFRRETATGREFYLDRRLDTDAVFLEEHIRALSHVPPRPSVHLRGTHHASTSSSDGKRTERKEVVDFDVTLDLTHLLYEDITRARAAWRTVVPAVNFAKVRRGTVFPTRAPGFGGSGSAVPEQGTPDLAEWCRRYCESRYGLRVFALERRVEGWDADLVRSKLEGLVRATNYRGDLQIDFPVLGSRVEVYSDCRTNRWRLTRWVEMLFVLTLLFLLSWPYLFFRTRWWETVEVHWHMSVVGDDGRKRYASMSEERWYNLWARPIQRAVLERRQGVVDQGDLEPGDAESGPFRVGFGGAVQAGVEAMGIVNRSFGWGGDAYRC